MADQHNRVIFCPVCGNEDFADGAKYCKICGTPAYNFCGNNNTFWPCNHINSPNARFCEMCGSETVYQLRGLLQDWRKEKEDYILNPHAHEGGSDTKRITRIDSLVPEDCAEGFTEINCYRAFMNMNVDAQ